jgi:rubrerythrin
MQPQANATSALQAPVDGLVRTRYTLVVCVVCGHERIHTPRQQTSCPECGASAYRSFALFRDLREEQR